MMKPSDVLRVDGEWYESSLHVTFQTSEHATAPKPGGQNAE
jgi:hypothetical protein